MRALVILPTYDEAESINTALDRVLDADPRLDVLVVDDNSPDGTGDLVERRRHTEPRLFVLHRPGKQGLGAAYRAGFAWGLQRGYDALVEMDADLSHPADRLPALLDGLHGADLVIGSRYVDGGRVRDWPWSRRLISRTGNQIVRTALGMPLRDATAGFRAYRRQLLENLPIADVTSNGYCFQIETAHRAWQQGFLIAEVPITFTERAAGSSKMSIAITVEALARVGLWALTGGRRRPRAVNPHSVANAGPSGADTIRAGGTENTASSGRPRAASARRPAALFLVVVLAGLITGGAVYAAASGHRGEKTQLGEHRPAAAGTTAGGTAPAATTAPPAARSRPTQPPPPTSAAPGSSRPGHGTAPPAAVALRGPQPLPSQLPGPTPTAVSIPAIGVHSTLLPLHLNARQELVPPPDFVHAGWYTGGPTPGADGPAVIAGHVDSYRGPAVFFRLRDLRPGDLVQVARSDSSTVTFRVQAVQRYPKNSFPTQTVYAPTPTPTLRLITCGGSFNYAERSYRDNIVVYAALSNTPGQ